MSFDTQAWAKKQITGSVSRKAVLMALAEYADERHSCYPSQATLAADTEQSERNVRRIIGDLEDMGLLVRERRTDDDGHRSSDRYVLPANMSARDTALPDTGGHPYRTPVSAEETGEQSDNSLSSASADNVDPKLYTKNGVPVALNALPVGRFPIEFEKTWAIYPKARRLEKRATYGAWRASVEREVKAGNKDVRAVMLAIYRAVANYREAVADREPQFVKHAKTFLGPSDAWKDHSGPPKPRLKEYEA